MKLATWAFPAIAGLVLTGLVLADPLSQASPPHAAGARPVPAASASGTPASTPRQLAAREDVTAQDLLLAYQGDGTLADRRFKGVRFTVHGVVSDVDTDEGGNALVTLRAGKDPDADPRFSFGKEGWSVLATWAKGSKVTLVCTGKGATGGRPVADACAVP